MWERGHFRAAVGTRKWFDRQFQRAVCWGSLNSDRVLLQPNGLQERGERDPIQAAELGQFDYIDPPLTRFALRDEGSVGAEFFSHFELGQPSSLAGFT